MQVSPAVPHTREAIVGRNIQSEKEGVNVNSTCRDLNVCKVKVLTDWPVTRESMTKQHRKEQLNEVREVVLYTVGYCECVDDNFGVDSI